MIFSGSWEESIRTRPRPSYILFPHSNYKAEKPTGKYIIAWDINQVQQAMQARNVANSASHLCTKYVILKVMWRYGLQLGIQSGNASRYACWQCWTYNQTVRHNCGAFVSISFIIKKTVRLREKVCLAADNYFILLYSFCCKYFVTDKQLRVTCGNKMPTRCNRGVLLQILLLAQHVSGTTMPIIRSSRVLYSGCCLWYFVLWFSQAATTV